MIVRRAPPRSVTAPARPAAPSPGSAAAMAQTRRAAPSAGPAAALLERQAGAIAHQAPRPGALVVVGGDTLRALCVAAGVRTLLAQSSPLPGWGRAQLVGGNWDGVPCYSRSGAFGDAEDLTTMVRLLTGGRGNRKETPT